MIKIQNIYHMLAYAFHALNESEYKEFGTEKFENAADLLSAIIIKGIKTQLKRELGRTYLDKTESLSCLHGKIDITESIKQQTLIKHQLICAYDELSVDSYMNRILKTTMKLLLQYDIDKSRKKGLQELLLYFAEIKTIKIHSINWRFAFHRNNQTYQMLMSICQLIIKGLLQNTSDGSLKLMDFFNDQQMCHLHERFILGYYKRHFSQIKTNSLQIKWALDDKFDTMLPTMQTDITLTYNNKILIIDAKYYNQITQTRYNSNTYRSHNLYQIFTYVKNMASSDKGENKEVSGMLLYAKPDDEINHDSTYIMSGNKITIKTLDLNCDFKEIAKQLDLIAKNLIGI
ncbi:5-methylcytosine-specific restriction endonuclease system specificity protein McrC [Helicobacter colisuis]|uniref:5-methylcytosine-specific restriction endonuclease system specificity protein McrC n=1 Tax=Helicobacter colisuis TaxID=2949739 RepID=A0ABT0TSG0_9HELI|nr:5-methylcytosine-specific restriction endonuclease system specificity protein McrC [Helicobacter colisuis]